MTSPLITIDGSYGEGGGQIIRTSLSLSAITGKPLEIVNIRARRSKPGLQPQHLMAVRAAASLSNARLEGDAVGSARLLFIPSPAEVLPASERELFDIGTAGATPLVAQTVLLPLALRGLIAQVTILGGTHVPHAPPAEYLEAVYLPTLVQAGIEARFDYSSAGFYPRGGGELDLVIAPTSGIQSIRMTERGQLKSLRAYIVTSSLPEHVAERGASTVEKFMKEIGQRVEIVHREKPSRGAGAAVVLAAECEGGRAGFTGIGERGKPMERVAEGPCRAFVEWWNSGTACDEHLADQLALPMAVASGESEWNTPRITEHLRTVIWVIQQFLPVDVELEETPDGLGKVRMKPL